MQEMQCKHIFIYFLHFIYNKVFKIKIYSKIIILMNLDITYTLHYNFFVLYQIALYLY